MQFYTGEGRDGGVGFMNGISNSEGYGGLIGSSGARPCGRNPSTYRRTCRTLCRHMIPYYRSDPGEGTDRRILDRILDRSSRPSFRDRRNHPGAGRDRTAQAPARVGRTRRGTRPYPAPAPASDCRIDRRG